MFEGCKFAKYKLLPKEHRKELIFPNTLSL